jgi:hypothetical protein
MLKPDLDMADLTNVTHCLCRARQRTATSRKSRRSPTLGPPPHALRVLTQKLADAPRGGGSVEGCRKSREFANGSLLRKF